MPRLSAGHAPGHVRDTFRAAIEAYIGWNDGEPEPVVEYEIRYEPHEIPISKACGLVWNCTDIIPGLDFDWLKDNVPRGLEPQRQTYAACARSLHAAIQHYLAH